MFGYITPEKPELKIREYEIFRAYYCAICKEMGRKCGHVSRFTLSYDATFLAMLLASVNAEEDLIRTERCPVHPMKKRAVIISNRSVTGYAADVNVLLAYYNLKDDIRDDGSLKYRTACTFLRWAARNAGKRQPAVLESIKDMVEKLQIIEKQKCSSMDKASEPFANMMSVLLSQRKDLIGEKNIEALKWIGYNIGKWLYIIDACDDLEKDMRSGNYNPLVCMFGGEDIGIDAVRSKMHERVEFSLTYTLSETAKAVGLLEINKNRGIIENIVYMGMLRITEKILGT